MIWDKFFTFGPVALLLERAISGKLFLFAHGPGGNWSLNLGWMAELFVEESWDINWLSWVNNWINWSSWFVSVDPLASCWASCGRVLGEALLDDVNILGHVHWCTEIEVWNKFFTFRPGAALSKRAFSSRVRSDALSPLGNWSILRYLSWVAKLSWEHWSLSTLVSRVISGSSLSPLASIVTFSNLGGREAGLDQINVSG